MIYAAYAINIVRDHHNMTNILFLRNICAVAMFPELMVSSILLLFINSNFIRFFPGDR